MYKDQIEKETLEVECPHCQEKFSIDVEIGITKPDVPDVDVEISIK